MKTKVGPRLGARSFEARQRGILIGVAVGLGSWTDLG